MPNPRRKPKNAFNKYKPQLSSPPPTDPPKKRWWKAKRFVIIFYSTLVIIFTIIAWYFTAEQAKEKLMSPHELYEEKDFIKGVYLPFILDENRKVTISIASNLYHYSPKELKSGIKINLNQKSRTEIYLKAIGIQLYISTVFKDIRTGHVIGEMNYNKWKLKRPEIYQFHNSDDNMEVIDANGFVVFNMQYVPIENEVKIRGYFMNGLMVSVLQDIVEVFYMEDQKEDAIPAIKDIKPLNKYN